MKKKIIILGICLVLAAGTVAAVASGAYNNQNIDIKSALSKVFSSEKSEKSLVQKDSVQTDSISLNDDQNKSVISTDLSDKAIALYPSNFYSMVEILKSNISDTESIADILASYLYLRDIYGLNNEQLEYIAGLITNGADPNSILDPVYAINPKSRFGQAARYDKEMKDWWEATNEVNLWLHNDLKAPMDVSSTVEIMDGTAKITYQGTATSLENENVEIYKEVVIDFPVSANLEIEKTE